MGLTLDARCGSCGFTQADIRVGSTMAMMSGERRSAFHLFACPGCRSIASVELFLGEPPSAQRCDRCRAPLETAPARELRVVPMKGLKLDGHACPSCAAAALGFTKKSSWL